MLLRVLMFWHLKNVLGANNKKQLMSELGADWVVKTIIASSHFYIKGTNTEKKRQEEKYPLIVEQVLF